MPRATAPSWYVNDHRGAPTRLVNNDGAVVWSAAYDAFGRAQVDPDETVEQPRRLPPRARSGRRLGRRRRRARHCRAPDVLHHAGLYRRKELIAADHDELVRRRDRLEVVFHEDGADSSVAVIRHRESGVLYRRVNGKTDAGTGNDHDPARDGLAVP